MSGLQAGSPWPMTGYCPTHQGHSPFPGPTSLHIKWTFAANGAVDSSPAIGADGTVYVGSNDFNLYAVNGSDGKQKWAFQTGGQVTSSPAIGANGMVYFGSQDSRVYAVDGASGTLRWSYLTQDLVTSSPVIGGDGTVYIGSQDERIYAFDGNTGAEKWTYQTGGNVFNSPALGPSGQLYVSTNDNLLYAVDAKSGSLTWSVMPYFGFGAGSNAVIDGDGTVYAGGAHAVIAVAGDTGATRWIYKVQNFVVSMPSMADGMLFIEGDGNVSNMLSALDATSGTQLWSFTAVSVVYYTSPTISANGILYFGGLDKNFYAVSATSHQQLWSYQTGGEFRSSAAIGSDGTVYVGSGDNNLYAFSR